MRKTNRVLDDLLLGKVGLVTDEKLVDAFGCVSVNLLQPLLDIGKSVLIRHIVNDNDAVRSSVCDRKSPLS